MIITAADATSIRTKTLRDIDTTGRPNSKDHHVIEGFESGGLLAVVEHNLTPRVPAAPLHRHSREDEYSLVMEGQLGVLRMARKWSSDLASWCSRRGAAGTPSGTPVRRRYESWN